MKLFTSLKVCCFLAGMFLFLLLPLRAQETPDQTPIPTLPGNTIIGIMPGFFRYSGDVDEPVNSVNVEVFGRFPFTHDEHWSIYCGIGYSELEGVDNDANVPSRDFMTTNPFFYAVVMPGYKFELTEKMSLWLKAGLGGGNLKSVNSETDGVKPLIPTGLEFNYQAAPRWVFMANLGYIFSMSDLDGLKRKTDIDYRQNDNLLNISFGVGFIP